MDWYYARGEERLGPVGQEEFDALVEGAAITQDTLVWNQDLPDWQPYGDVPAGGGAADAPPPLVGLGDAGAGVGDDDAGLAEALDCVECGRPFPRDDMLRYGDVWVCGECKPVFYQRLQEGAVLPGVFEYGGFWIRFVAKFVDNLITMAAGFAVQAVLAPLLIFGSGEDATGVGLVLSMIAYYILSMAIPLAYSTWFVGKYGATPGKMACGLKVVRSDGERVTYLRAFARYFAEMVSGMILLIGYIMAAFDEEKRTLHDHMCDTRVVTAQSLASRGV